MAIGLSGSNGGISRDTNTNLKVDLLNRPLEVSYFVNNICNLACKHCYVGYEEKVGDLSTEEWKDTFDKLIRRGALTFGNVGKEPLLSSKKTLALLKHLKQRRDENPRIRFGLVTNGTLLDGDVVKEIREISPDYIDVSLDGTRAEHDYIRGKGNFERTMRNLRELPSSLKEKVFISYTLMSHNQDSFENLVSELAYDGFRRFLVSPFVSTPSSNGELVVANKEIADFYQRILDGNEVDFGCLEGVEILLKIDYDSQKPLMDRLVNQGAIDVNNLLVDSYGVLFNEYSQSNDSRVVINYMPFSDTLSRAIRISHDGYVSGCLEMFHKDYQMRAKGNIKEKRIEELLDV